MAVEQISVALKVPELLPVLEKVASLREHANVRFVYEAVLDVVTRANSAAMGQSACEWIITMCNPKGWGDQLMGTFGNHDFAWTEFLSELSDLADKSGQQIFENSRLSE